MARWYVLDEAGEPVPASLLDGARGMDDPRRIIAQDLLGDIRVSTVFLCLDHGYYDDEPPVLWETMIFGGKHDQREWRYISRADAVEGHRAALDLVLNDP